MAEDTKQQEGKNRAQRREFDHFTEATVDCSLQAKDEMDDVAHVVFTMPALSLDSGGRTRWTGE